MDEPSIASDHALLLAAICAGRAAYVPLEPFEEICGNVIVGGVGSYPTRLDEYRCPILSDEIRDALRSVMN